MLVVAFASLLVQAKVLFGTHGLLPACEHLARTDAWSTPSLFRLDCRDRTLVWAAALGMLLGAGLVVDRAPRWCLAAAWVLYASFVHVGQDFLSFQWDNLLLETALFALPVVPGGLRPARPWTPPSLGVFLLRWLLFRLNVESGAAKLLGGDPTWWNLTAMATYYETAPLPTWVGWWAHQLPLAVHQASSLFGLVVELVVAPLVFGPRRLQPFVFALLALFQVTVIASANYGFFNYLSLALCLLVLDDGHLPARAAPPAARRMGLVRGLAGAVLALLTLVPFLPWIAPLRDVQRTLLPLARFLQTTRSVNAYHLFAHMTLVRREAVIEGSDDGVDWKPYELRWKPGDPERPPAFVAPHQPRVDFQLWFLLLGRRAMPAYLDALLTRLRTEPRAVASLFARDPFGGRPPAELRVAVWQYGFTDRATRAETGAWWHRRLLGYLSP